MTVRLYLETNFLLSHAYGRDPATGQLIADQFHGLTIAIPASCLMEALTHWEGERKRSESEIRSLGKLASEFKRNSISTHAARLVTLFVEAQAAWASERRFFEDRLREVIAWLADPSRVTCLAGRPGRLISLDLDPAQLDPTDELILGVILDDAQGYPDEQKVFVTENRRCFQDNVKVRQTLQAAGLRYFPSATIFLQWYEAGAES